MTDQTKADAGRHARRMKTWSRFAGVGRLPTEYEIVTHNMNHTRGTTPLEMGANVHGNQWLMRHRDGMTLEVPDWELFRDPDQITYRKYTHDQDEQETYVDGLLAEHTEARRSDEQLTQRPLEFLRLCLTPCRYLAHGQQMVSAYVQQLAPSSYVGNCAAFQTADELRRVQRIAYRTKQLANAHPAAAFGTTERGLWQTDADWQPIRKTIELLFVAYDWDEAFVALNLVVKPIADQLFLAEFGTVAREHSDELDAALNDNLYLDAQRSRRWSSALCKFLIEVNAANRNALRDTVARWRPHGEEVLAAGARLLSRYAASAGAAEIAARTRGSWLALLQQARLSDDG